MADGGGDSSPAELLWTFIAFCGLLVIGLLYMCDAPEEKLKIAWIIEAVPIALAVIMWISKLQDTTWFDQWRRSSNEKYRGRRMPPVATISDDDGLEARLHGPYQRHLHDPLVPQPVNPLDRGRNLGEET